MGQGAHEAWNAQHYPGTRQLCSQCDEPTGRMATEITPQERAAALYGSLNAYVPYERCVSDKEFEQVEIDRREDIDDIVYLIQQTRRAALLEAAQRAGLGDCNSLLDAPCLWCGYNGSGYYQAGTHDQSCIWRDVGGERERIDRLAQEGGGAHHNMKLYKCPKCGATYTHDKACNHATYTCPKRVKKMSTSQTHETPSSR